jgi:hypothetical protein
VPFDFPTRSPLSHHSTCPLALAHITNPPCHLNLLMYLLHGRPRLVARLRRYIRWDFKTKLEHFCSDIVRRASWRFSQNNSGGINGIKVRSAFFSPQFTSFSYFRDLLFIPSVCVCYLISDSTTDHPSLSRSRFHYISHCYSLCRSHSTYSYLNIYKNHVLPRVQ